MHPPLVTMLRYRFNRQMNNLMSCNRSIMRFLNSHFSPLRLHAGDLRLQLTLLHSVRLLRYTPPSTRRCAQFLPSLDWHGQQSMRRAMPAQHAARNGGHVKADYSIQETRISATGGAAWWIASITIIPSVHHPVNLISNTTKSPSTGSSIPHFISYRLFTISCWWSNKSVDESWCLGFGPSDPWLVAPWSIRSFTNLQVIVLAITVSVY